MAEGYLRATYGHLFEVGSAGTGMRGLYPWAVAVMKEIEIDISCRRSRLIADSFDGRTDIVVTICDTAHQACPFFPGAKNRIHASFPDPSACTGTPDECLARFRQVRDKITAWIDTFFVPHYGYSPSTGCGRAGNEGECVKKEFHHAPFNPEIHRAENGVIYQSVRSCDLERICEK
jgi:arsenate reductase